MADNVKERVVWGAVLGGAGVALIVAGPYTALIAAIAIQIGSSFEYFNLVQGLRRAHVIQCVLCSLLGTLGFLCFGFPGFFAGALLSAMVLGVLLLSWIETDTLSLRPREVVAPCLMGLAYPTTFSATLCICALEVPSSVLLWFIATVVANDSFAYFFGKGVGGRKLSQRISPKKTYAGLYGGVAGAALVSVVLGRLLLVEQGIIPLFLYGAIIAIFAVAGDLVESLVKRAFDVKDSGTIIPGHGGVLDRADAILFAAPLLFLLM